MTHANAMGGSSQSGESSTSMVPPQVEHRPGRAGALNPSLERPQATQYVRKTRRRERHSDACAAADGSASSAHRVPLPHLLQRVAGHRLATALRRGVAPNRQSLRNATAPRR
jgi:hypothetical protein